MYDESIVEVSTGQLVRLPELSSRLAVGEKGSVSLFHFTARAIHSICSQDILPPPTNGVQNLFGFLLGNHRAGGVDTVIGVKHTVYAVAWLALNQTVRLCQRKSWSVYH